jgi:SAM-dependent methyltransferase
MVPREHWDRIYRIRKPTELSWYQPEPALSLSLIRRVVPDRSAALIDVGGGASTLVDGLVALGYTSVSVLDVSGAALAHASARLGGEASRVTWLEANILDARLAPSRYELWHDRAVFHFLTDTADRRRYVQQVRGAVRVGGHVVVATFAGNGPTRCSGLEVVRYEPRELHAEFGSDFQLLESLREKHRTPAGVDQPFIYCVFRTGNGGQQRV